MQTRGQHLLLDLWLAQDVEEGSIERLFNLIRSRFTVVHEVKRAFEPFGLTAVFVLSESHFTLHTYPEHAYLSIDLYVCNFAVDLSAFAEEMKSLFNLREAKGSVFLRGVSGPGSSHTRAYCSCYPAAQVEELAS